MSTISEKQQDFAINLFNIGAVKFGHFKIKIHEKYPHAPLSPVYCDLRIIRRFPEMKNKAVDLYEEIIRKLTFDLLSDIPTAATPFTSSLSDRLSIGVITPRSDSKTYGSGNRIDGLLKEDKGKKAVLIDDVVSSADSKITAADTLRKGEVVVNDIVVLIDREQGGREMLKANNLNLFSSMTISHLLDFYLGIGLIDEEEYEQSLEGIDKLSNFTKNINTKSNI